MGKQKKADKMLSRSVLRRFSQCAAMTSKTVMPRQITLQSNKTLSCTQKRFISLSFKLNSDGSEQSPTIETRLEGMVNQSDVVVFMKGVPAQPRCGFSNAVCQIMRMHDVPFVGHDILSEEEVRNEIKTYKGWPTFPQVYFDGEFIGGCDVLIEMHQSGELIEEFNKIGIKSALLTAE